MDTSDLRRELARSVGLLAGPERWLFAGLLGGGAGYLVWLAGTGVAVSRGAQALFGPGPPVDSVSAGSWSSEATALAVVFALLWVVAPAALAVRFVVGNLTNIRGNIDQPYRMDRPLVLLVVPLVALGVAVGVGVARGAVSAPVLVLVGVANALLLVRTVAYGYRVYAFSRPWLLRGLLFVAAAVAALAVVSEAGSLTGQTDLVTAAAERYGVADLAFGEVSTGGYTATKLPLAAALAPGALALAYLVAQLLASLAVRIRRPDVPRSAIRAGQRYPAVVQPGTTRRLAMGTGTGTGPGPGASADADGASTSDAGASGADVDDTDDADDTPGDGADTGSATGDGADTGDGPGGADASPDDRMGQTRVFTPPDDAEVAADGDSSPGDGTAETAGGSSEAVDGEATNVVGGDGAVKNELCPICGATYEADPDRTNCPNCNALLDAE